MYFHHTLFKLTSNSIRRITDSCSASSVAKCKDVISDIPSCLRDLYTLTSSLPAPFYLLAVAFRTYLPAVSCF